MTTVVAVQGHDGLIFGSDSQLSSETKFDNLFSGKIVENDIFTIGVAGQITAIQAVQFADLPVPPKTPPTYARFVKTSLLPDTFRVHCF